MNATVAALVLAVAACVLNLTMTLEIGMPRRRVLRCEFDIEKMRRRDNRTGGL